MPHLKWQHPGEQGQAKVQAPLCWSLAGAWCINPGLEAIPAPHLMVVASLCSTAARQSGWQRVTCVPENKEQPLIRRRTLITSCYTRLLPHLDHMTSCR